MWVSLTLRVKDITDAEVPKKGNSEQTEHKNDHVLLSSVNVSDECIVASVDSMNKTHYGNVSADITKSEKSLCPMTLPYAKTMTSH